MTLDQLNELEAHANNAAPAAWDELVEVCFGRQSDTIKDFARAANPATVKALIGAVRKLAQWNAQTQSHHTSLGCRITPDDVKVVTERYIQQALLEAGE